MQELGHLYSVVVNDTYSADSLLRRRKVFQLSWMISKMKKMKWDTAERGSCQCGNADTGLGNRTEGFQLNTYMF